MLAMSTLQPPANPEKDPRIKAVFDDIRATRGVRGVVVHGRYLDRGGLDSLLATAEAAAARPPARP